MAKATTAEDVASWADEVEAVGRRIGPRFVRSEPRERAAGYIRGLLGDAQRKNGWQLAEHLGDATAYSTSWRGRLGTPTPSATTSWRTSARTWASPMAS